MPGFSLRVWHPISFQVLVKNLKAPHYLKDHLRQSNPTWPLKSLAECLVQEVLQADARLARTKGRAFLVAVPQLWNSFHRVVCLALSLNFWLQHPCFFLLNSHFLLCFPGFFEEQDLALAITDHWLYCSLCMIFDTSHGIFPPFLLVTVLAPIATFALIPLIPSVCSSSLFYSLLLPIHLCIGISNLSCCHVFTEFLKGQFWNCDFSFYYTTFSFSSKTPHNYLNEATTLPCCLHPQLVQ